MLDQARDPTDSASAPVVRPAPRATFAEVALPRVMGALVALKFWLVWAQTHGAIAIAGYDDALYMNLANHLVNGNWLGPYDLVTLLKPPGYSIWIAGNYFTGQPLHLNQHLIYAGACALFVQAIAPRVPSRLLRLVLFAVLLFQPMSFSTSTLRYVRDSLYTTQVLSVLSCAIALVIRVDAPVRILTRWSLALGLIGGFMWVTRDEGVVILPALGCAAALMALHLWRHRPADWRRRALAIGIAVPVAATVVLTVALLNYRHYGFFGVSEFKATELNDAMGALARVEPAQHRRWVIVANETRSRIYERSAAFREIQTALENRRDQWSAAGTVMFEWDRAAEQEEIKTGTLLGTVCHEPVEWDDAVMRAEIMTGWFVIALREAVVVAGLQKTPADGMAYFRRLADEVNAACEAGELQCGPRRSSLAPPWRWDYLGLTLRRTCRGAARLLTLEDIIMFPTLGSEEQLAPFRALTRDRLAPVATTPPSPPAERTAVDQWRLNRLAEIHRAYAAVLPASAIAVTACIVLGLAFGRRRGSWPLLGAALVLLLAIGGRLGLLAYMDATAFPRSLIPLYMMPIYPLTIALFLLILIDGIRVLSQASRRVDLVSK